MRLTCIIRTKADPVLFFIGFSNRVEAWTRDVKFLLRQEGRPTTVLIGNESTVRIMDRDWQNVDKVTEWIRYKAAQLNQPFVLSLGLNLPHPYPTPSMGEAPGGSTFKTSPYWLKKVYRGACMLFLLCCIIFIFHILIVSLYILFDILFQYVE